ADGGSYGAAAVPASFSGSATDNNGGVGLNANSTTFTLQRSSDNFYWAGSAWQAAVSNLAATHSATTSNTAAAWASSATLPTFERGVDSLYWTGSAWQGGVFNLATTQNATTGNTAAAWSSSATMPAWASQSDGTYTARATATDKVGNTFSGSAVSFTLQNVAPATASVTTPADGSLYRAATVPAGFSGSAAERNGGDGLNANSTTFTLH